MKQFMNRAGGSLIALLFATLGHQQPPPATPPQAECLPIVEIQPTSVKAQHRSKFQAARSRVNKVKILKRYTFWLVAKKHGYTYKQWKKLDYIWTHEAHWNWQAKGEPTSTGRAFGIPQVKWSAPIRDPFRQIEKGLEYIQHTYATVQDPTGIDHAYKHWLKHRWY